jgi:hypothetical protein
MVEGKMIEGKDKVILIPIYRSFNIRFNTFPAEDLGNLSTNSTDLGFLKLAMCALQ